MLQSMIRAELFIGGLSDALPMCAIASLFVSAYLTWRGRKELADFFFWISLSNLGMTMAVAWSLSGARSGIRYDLYINRIDGYFGHPSNFANRLIAGNFLITSAAYLDYLFYWALILVAIYIAAKSSVRNGWEMFLRFALSGVLAVPIFLLCPVAGPKYIEGFPAIYSGPVHPITLSIVPNCVPSVHFSVALLILWALRKSRLGLLVGIAHVFLTIVATLGFGAHYAFDLIVAVPYTVFILLIPIPINDLVVGASRLFQPCAPTSQI